MLLAAYVGHYCTPVWLHYCSYLCYHCSLCCAGPASRWLQHVPSRTVERVGGVELMHEDVWDWSVRAEENVHVCMYV